MATATFQPKWWNDQHASQWDNLKGALERDWNQTKADLHLGGRELNQNVTDTLDQAAGAAPLPPQDEPNDVGVTNGRYVRWDYAELPLRYGVGARAQYGAQHMEWSDDLESTLKSEWETSAGDASGDWLEVRAIVRHGYERARN